MNPAFSVVDLFCGAGGLSKGFRDAGFELLQGIDNDPAPLATYRMNLGEHVRQAQIGEDIEVPEATVITGGPPCQGFSSAGLRRHGDHRNTLVSCFAAIVARMRPLAFVFENVEGFLTAEGGSRVLELLEPLVAVGYRIHLRKVNAANYGIAQHRKRVIAIGGLGWNPSFPEPTHSAYGAPGAALAGTWLPRTPSLENAISGLPTPSEVHPGIPDGHFARPFVGKDLERAKLLAPGQSMRDLPPAMWHESFERRANRRVMDGTPRERRGGAPFGIRRLRADEPSKTITGGALAEFIHPSENRPLTLRECARLQSFPDDYVFLGTPGDQARSIGNAVPPHLGFVVARAIAAKLITVEVKTEAGSLLSFIPTLSDGLSPALDKVRKLVRKQFSIGEAEPPTQRVLWH